MYEVQTTVPFKRVADLFCNAAEGGSNYWMQSAELLSSDVTPEPGLVWWGTEAIFGGKFSFEVGYDDPEGEEGAGEGKKTLTQDDVAKGLALFSKLFPSAFGDFMQENDDANTGDLFMQCIVLYDECSKAQDAIYG